MGTLSSSISAFCVEVSVINKSVSTVVFCLFQSMYHKFGVYINRLRELLQTMSTPHPQYVSSLAIFQVAEFTCIGIIWDENKMSTSVDI